MQCALGRPPPPFRAAAAAGPEYGRDGASRGVLQGWSWLCDGIMLVTIATAGVHANRWKRAASDEEKPASAQGCSL